jgi:uncharacterized Rossmann fold enzyme
MIEAPLGKILRTRDLVMGAPYVELEIVPTLQAQRDANCARGLPSVRKDGRRDKRVAIVGYGPSLLDTWPALLERKYDAIWTVSKAHDFLVERGIIPSRHVDTDYRDHKVGYNRLWQSTTHYVMATQIHPTYLDALAGQDVSLFHVVQPNGGSYDPRYYKSTVAFDSGLQAARLAYELGYRTQSWHGLDASARGSQTHAGPHEGVRPPPVTLEVAGQLRTMSAFLIRQALFCEKMLCKLPYLRVTILGDGALRPFLQERGKCRVF